MNTHQAWRELTRNLIDCIGALEDDEYLIISYKHANLFVQFADQGQFGTRGEASSNQYIEPLHARLTEAQYAAMKRMGWNRATLAADEHSTDGSPNFFVEFPYRSDLTTLAAMSVRTLRSVFGIAHPGMLQYHAFHSNGESIRFPTLRISRQVHVTASE